jgi:hypothetical protein
MKRIALGVLFAVLLLGMAFTTVFVMFQVNVSSQRWLNYEYTAVGVAAARANLRVPGGVDPDAGVWGRPTDGRSCLSRRWPAKKEVGKSTVWGAWPRSDQPSCNDFYFPRSEADYSVNFEEYCEPALSGTVRRGEGNLYIAAISELDNSPEFNSLALTEADIALIEARNTPSYTYFGTKFADCVHEVFEIEKTMVLTCQGFSVHHYKATRQSMPSRCKTPIQWK